MNFPLIRLFTNLKLITIHMFCGTYYYKRKTKILGILIKALAPHQTPDDNVNHIFCFVCFLFGFFFVVFCFCFFKTFAIAFSIDGKHYLHQLRKLSTLHPQAMLLKVTMKLICFLYYSSHGPLYNVFSEFYLKHLIFIH